MPVASINNLISEARRRRVFRTAAFTRVLWPRKWFSDTTDPGENTTYKIAYRTCLGERDLALELLLRGYGEWEISSGQWIELQTYPWLEYLRQDPDVASAIERHEQKKAEIADELREMVEQPEWRL